MATKRDISHLPPEEQARIERRRANHTRWRERNRVGERERGRIAQQKYRAENPIASKASIERWRQANPGAVAEMHRRSYAKRAVAISERRREAWASNENGCREKRARYEAEKRKTCPQTRLSGAIRQRLSMHCRSSGTGRAGSAVRDLGCTVPELMAHLEKQFLPGMTWENRGRYGWHIDHIKPLASFDLTDREQFLEACHYTNLQPLWWQDNLAKGANCA